MEINNIQFRIDKNPNNTFWKPIGMFGNIPYMLINGVWYRCGISFEQRSGKNFILFNDPMIVDERNVIKEHLVRGRYLEAEISPWRKQWILYRLNRHPLNFKIFNFKKTWLEWRGRRLVFSIVLLLTVSLFLATKFWDNEFLNKLSSNIWIQLLSWFLTFLGIFAIFTPKNATLNKE